MTSTEEMVASTNQRILGKGELKKGKSVQLAGPLAQPPKCPECKSQKVWKDGVRKTGNGNTQRYLCRSCGFRFSESTSQLGVKVNVSRQFVKVSNSKHNLSHGQVLGWDFTIEKPINDFPLFRSEEASAHFTSKVTNPETLNVLRSKYSNAKVCVSDNGAKNLVKVETRQKQAAGATTSARIHQGKILEWLWHLKKKGLADCSINQYGKVLRELAKKCDVLEPENVKAVIAEEKWNNKTKSNTVTIYNEFAKWAGLKWEPPKYKPVRKLPFIPTEVELDRLIAASGPKVSTFLQLLKETGMRAGEARRLGWCDIDFKRKLIQVNSPEKGSNPRILPMSDKLSGMFQRLPKKQDRVFSFYTHVNFYMQRKKIVRKLNDPRIGLIHLHTFRHWKGTTEYHKTHDVLHVKQILGHRDINSTLLYINLEEALFQANDEFHVKVAKTVEEACKLIEVGFEYVTEINSDKIFRKRK